MKKIISLIFVFVFAFSLSACGKDKEENKDNVDIEYYANAGQMPECKYSLGDDVETVKSELSKTAESDESEETVYNVTEGENNVLIDNGTFCYYYKKAQPEKGIGCIVNYGSAYGFEIGTVILDVKNAVGAEKCVEEELNEQNSFFMFGVTDGTALRCSIEDKNVVFIFENNALCGTALFVGNDW